MIHATRVRISAMLVATALVLAACGGTPAKSSESAVSASPTTTTTGTPAPMTKVTFLMDFLVSGWHAPAYVGVDQGFFAKQGLDVTVQPGQGSVDGATKVAANAAQFAQIDSTSALNAIAKGGNLLLIGVIDQTYPGGLCYLSERKTINALSDVVGLRVGSAEGDAYVVPLPGLLTKAGLDPKGYKHVVMTPANYTAALFADQIDAYACSRATFWPGAAAAAKAGLTLKMFRYADAGFNAIGHALVVNGELAKKDPDLVQRFVNAWAYANVWSWANPKDAMDDFLKLNPTIDPTVANETFLDREKSYAADGGFFTFDKAKVAATVEFVNAAYSAHLNPEDVYTNEFVDTLPEAERQGHLPN